MKLVETQEEMESRHAQESSSAELRRTAARITARKRAEERAKASAAKAAAKLSAEFQDLVLSQTITAARFDGDCSEGAYVITFNTGVELTFSAQGDDATCVTLEVKR